MNAVRIVAASVLLALPIVALSRAPYTPAGAGDAVLRLSWRMSMSAREECRPRTQQELDALPVHMRTPEVCTRDRASYVLVTQVGDERPDTTGLLRGGVKGDRPLFVLDERRLAIGQHRIRVELLRGTDTAGSIMLASLDTLLSFQPGTVRLVTMDGDAVRLVIRSSAPE
jgi:hypothetical protein